MHVEGLIFCQCENDHGFYIADSEEINLDMVTCPICRAYVATEASRTVLVATTGKDAMKLLDSKVVEAIRNMQ